MSRPVSLSIGEISKAARASVEKALSAHKASFPTIPEHRMGYFPRCHWVGFVISNGKKDHLTLGEAQKLATEVHGGIAGSVSGTKGGKPGFVVGDGNLTIGFAPPIEVDIFEA